MSKLLEITHSIKLINNGCINQITLNQLTESPLPSRWIGYFTKNLFLHFFFLAAQIQQKLRQALESCSVNLRMGELKGHFYLVWGIIWAILLLCPIFSRLHSYYSSLLLHVYPVGRHNTSWVSEFLVWNAQQGYPNGIFTLKEWFCLSLMSLWTHLFFPQLMWCIETAMWLVVGSLQGGL